MPAGVVLHRGAGCVRLDRLNALLGIGLRLVTLAGGDDLAIRGLQVESELTGMIFAELKLGRQARSPSRSGFVGRHATTTPDRYWRLWRTNKAANGGTVTTGRRVQHTVDDDERQALQAEGLDAYDPAVIAARPCPMGTLARYLTQGTRPTGVRAPRPGHRMDIQIADLPATSPLTAKTASGQHSRAYPPSMRGKKTAIAGAVIVLAGCGGPSQTAVTTRTSILEIPKTVTVTAPPPPSVPKMIMETDGTYRVGTDIVPGTYRSAGPSAEGASDCYWARLRSLNETNIIESNISTNYQEVIIKPSDRAFLTHSCQPWQKAD
jgi:hypothetical protein